MRTLHTAYRITNLPASLDFYLEVGFEEVGRVLLPDDMTLVLLKLPDDEVATLELVDEPAARPVDIGNAISHIGIQVDDLAATVVRLSRAGVACGPIEHPGPATCWLTDPDGYRLELVEWPPGHPVGITAADFVEG
jgi:lactoylglutathione lyase